MNNLNVETRGADADVARELKPGRYMAPAPIPVSHGPDRDGRVLQAMLIVVVVLSFAGLFLDLRTASITLTVALAGLACSSGRG